MNSTRRSEFTQTPKKTPETIEEGGESCFETTAEWASLIIAIITFPISIFICVVYAFEYERAVIFRLGRLRRRTAYGPGVFFILPCIDDYFRVDLRTETFDVYPQEILTKDNVSIRLDAVVFFRVVDPVLAIVQIENYKYSTMLLAKTTLRNIAGTKKLGQIITEREEISQLLRDILDQATDEWGICVERVEIKDVRLPTALQRSLAAEAEAGREAKARKISAEGEQNAANALREASQVMSTSPIAVQLRYLQTLCTISAENNSTIVVPLPFDLVKRWMMNPGHGSSSTYPSETIPNTNVI